MEREVFSQASIPYLILNKLWCVSAPKPYPVFEAAHRQNNDYSKAKPRAADHQHIGLLASRCGTDSTAVRVVVRCRLARGALRAATLRLPER